jgi:hypothetical protein
MNEQKLVEESQKLIDAAFELKHMLSKHKNFFKWETHFGDDRDGKDYRVSMKIEQVVFNVDKTDVKYVVPPRLKDHIN